VKLLTFNAEHDRMLALNVIGKIMTAKDLLDISVKHESNLAVAVTLVAIREAQSQQDLAFNNLKVQLQMIELAAAHNGTYTSDSNDLVFAAAAHRAATAKLNSNFMNLACILQKLGETVNY